MAVETKVGVYLCSGCDIGEAVNIDELGKVASEESKVPICKNNPWLCSEAGVEEIKNDIKNENLNRVVIGACSSRFLADIFKFDSDVLVDRVNLRENVAWTHKPNNEDTQMLASDYLRMGIAKVRNSEPPKPQPVDVNEIILVVGGGVSGLTSALAAARAGNSVILTEKEDQLGGWLSKFHKVSLGNSPFTELESTGIEELISEVESNKKIKVYKSCLIEKISGAPGDFKVTLKINNEIQSEPLKVGAIVQATGWKEYDPNNLGELGYGKFDNVITGIQLEEYFKNGKPNSAMNGKPVESITFIQCAGSRDEKHLPYCSSICCSVSLKQALYVREKYPDALIYIIYKDIRTPAQRELFYKKVQEEDNIFFTKGEVNNITDDGNGKIILDVDETLLGEKISLKSDVVVLATGMVPTTLVGKVETSEENAEPAEKAKLEDGKKEAESAEVGAKILNLTYRQGTDLPTLMYGFPDSHYICFPYETRRTGIYAAGCVRSPMDINTSKNDSYGAAFKAIQLLNATKNGVAVHPRARDASAIDIFMQRCTQCKRCTEECPFGSMDEDEKGTPLPNPTRCRRCGICLGSCPERIITFKDYSIQSVSSMIKAVDIPDEFEEKPRILVFLCENDAYPSLDMVGKYRLQYDPNIRVIPVRCLGAVNVVWIADALSMGFDGIVMIGCKHGDDYQCHYIKGSELAEQRMENVQEKLKQLVLEPERVQIFNLSIDEYNKLPGIFNDFVEEITDMGFNPYKGM
ncbi:MAG: hydrogenase iron-sulfur subunit [Ignavibacteriaceae bacterium]|nr:hydrogenase iron-sulfur subunit [Ignavibacteriaceae bacterium]